MDIRTEVTNLDVSFVDGKVNPNGVTVRLRRVLVETGEQVGVPWRGPLDIATGGIPDGGPELPAEVSAALAAALAAQVEAFGVAS